MRIVFITNNYTPYSGGVVSSINVTVEQLRANGHEVFVVTLNFLDDNHTDPEWVFRVPCPIRFTYKTNPMAVPFRAHKNVLRLLDMLKPDIVHVHHPFLLGVAGYKAAQAIGIPIIFTYHTMYEKYAHYVPLPAMFTQPVIKKLAIDFCKKVQGIVVPSGGIYSFLRESGVQTPMRVIPSGIQECFFTQPTVGDRANRFQLLLVSRFQKEKNIPFVLDVFSKLDSARYSLTLVGYGAEYDALRAYAYESLGLNSDDVQFVVRPSRDELVDLYQRAHLFLFPSQTDTQGLVLVEAMAAGTPVVALDGPGQRDCVANGYNGFIVSDCKRMVEVIRQLGSNVDLYEELCVGARVTARCYAPIQTASQLFSFYQSYLV